MLISQSGIISSTDWYTIHKLYMCLNLHRQRLQYLDNVCQLFKKWFDTIQSYIATLSMAKQTCHMSKHGYSTHNVRQGED